MTTEKRKSQESEAVPMAVVNRLSLYLRELQRFVFLEKETTSSSELGQLLGFSDAQVRKDLAYFGQFGLPGVGYRSDVLALEIRKILGTDRDWAVLLVGVGNLGRALLGHKGFLQQGFKIVAAVDTQEDKIGNEFEGITVESFEKTPEIISREKISLGVIAVPASTAQIVADKLIEAGIEGILNFAPTSLSLPQGFPIQGVDLATQLEQVAFCVANQDRVR